MNDRKRISILFGSTAVVLLVLVGIVWLVNKLKVEKPVPPTPTPAPTAVPTQGAATRLVCKGGQVFLANPDVQKYLLSQYNLVVESLAMGSFEMINDLNGIDCVWLGSGISADFFNVNHPELKVKSDRIFATNTVVFTWRVPGGPDYVAALERIGWVYEKNGQYLLKMEPLIDAMVGGKTWADMGVPEIPGLVNIRFSAPEKSGGGQAWMYLIADYLASKGGNGVRTFNANDFETIMPILTNIWEAQPRQVTASPELFEEFVLSGYNGTPLVASSESLYLGWRTGLPGNRRKDADQIVGLYPEYTVTTDHIIFGLTDGGKQLVSILGSDQKLQEMAWTLMGMRTTAGGLNARPGDTEVTWIARSAQTLGDPKYADALPLLQAWGVAK
jgi:hypothetical protein